MPYFLDTVFPEGFTLCHTVSLDFVFERKNVEKKIFSKGYAIFGGMLYMRKYSNILNKNKTKTK